MAHGAMPNPASMGTHRMTRAIFNLLAIAALAYGAYRMWPRTINPATERQHAEARAFTQMRREADYKAFRYAHKHGTYRFSPYSLIKF